MDYYGSGCNSFYAVRDRFDGDWGIFANGRRVVWTTDKNRRTTFATATDAVHAVARSLAQQTLDGHRLDYNIRSEVVRVTPGGEVVETL
jgi:hypothetical protein